MLALARRGAEGRYQELQAELAQLTKLFPNLRKGDKASTPRRRTGRPQVVAAPPADSGRSKAKWSAAARKAVSARMKKYWAARRKAKKA
jgi:hypothetical protein